MKRIFVVSILSFVLLFTIGIVAYGEMAKEGSLSGKNTYAGTRKMKDAITAAADIVNSRGKGSLEVDRFCEPIASHCHGEPGALVCCEGEHGKTPSPCGPCTCFDNCEKLKARCVDHPDCTYNCDVDGLVCHCRPRNPES